MFQASQDLGGGGHLAVGVFHRDSVVVEVHPV
jgi:hypothetical protein